MKKMFQSNASAETSKASFVSGLEELKSKVLFDVTTEEGELYRALNSAFRMFYHRNSEVLQIKSPCLL
jgi:hypothetical protein